MSSTPSNMLDLGTAAPHFELRDVSTGKIVSEKLDHEDGLCIIFMCNHCPFVIHVIEEIIQIAKDYKGKIKTVAISSNDVENYPQDSPEKMDLFKQKYGMDFPYLYDESQAIAKVYNAACTPDFYLFDKNLKLVYRGQMDDSRPGNEAPVNGKDLRAAMDQVLKGEKISPDQKPSIGCNIKWK